MKLSRAKRKQIRARSYRVWLESKVKPTNLIITKEYVNQVIDQLRSVDHDTLKQVKLDLVSYKPFIQFSNRDML